MLAPLSQQLSLPATSTGTPAGDPSVRADAATARPATPTASTSEVPGAGQADPVTLTAPPNRPADAPAPVYAEVWKDGVKLAEIDSHGGVVSFAGLVAPPAGGGAGGPWLAAIRAAQVAQSVGGEIRINGLAVDAGTLRMRVQLDTVYGR